jgi:hypothetical protein
MKQLSSCWMDLRFCIGKFYWYLSTKFSSGYNQTKITNTLHKDPNAFFENNLLSSAPVMTAHWRCHGSEAMVIPFINFTTVHDLNKR